MLIRLIYTSTATEGVGLDEFKFILQQSQANNHRRDLTGVLAFNSKIFLQGLEGSREQVNELYAGLLRDKRHHTVAILDYAEIDEREWGQWSMGFAAPSADNRALFMKYSGQSVFNPYIMSSSAVKKMLGELARKSITMTVPGGQVNPGEPKATEFTPLPPRREPLVMRPPIAVSTAAAPAPITAPSRQPLAANRSAPDPGLVKRFLGL
jgi:Sensors of blue-light using FAD